MTHNQDRWTFSLYLLCYYYCFQTQQCAKTRTCECLDTQCRRTLRTRLVAARRITNSLSPFLWSVGNPKSQSKFKLIPFLPGNKYPQPMRVSNRLQIPMVPVLARDMRRYFSLVGVPSLAPAVAMAKAEAADKALRLVSSSRQDDITMPLL